MPDSAAAAAPAQPNPGLQLHADYAEVRTYLAPLIEAARKRHGIVGLSVGLVDVRDVVWLEGFGYADREAGRAAGPDTIYRVGSIAKTLTAAAVMQLAERDDIDIDQPLFAYLPGFDIRSRFNTTAEPITVRSVLHHHSGLPTDLLKSMWAPVPFTSVLAALEEEYTAFPPNLVFSYSNVGYSLLGHLIQKVSDRPFADYMDDVLLEPMAMDHSGYYLVPEYRSYLSRGYRDEQARRLPAIRDVPAMGFYSSARDLSRYARTMLAYGWTGKAEILMPGTVEEMYEVQNADLPLDLHIRTGLGWFIERDTVLGAGFMLRHGGTTMYFSSEIILLPDHGLAVVVLANTRGSRPVVSRVAEQILHVVLEMREGSRPAPRGDRLANLAVEESEASDEVDEFALDFDKPLGSFATDLGLLAIRPRDDKLCACVAEATIDLVPFPDGWYGASNAHRADLSKSLKGVAGMRFASRRVEGRDIIVARRGNEEILLGERIPPARISPAWQLRLGRYRIVNPDQDFPVREPLLYVQDDMLMMSYQVPLLSDKAVSVPLGVLNDDEAVVLGLGRSRGETLRVIRGRDGERLRYSGFEGKRIND